MAEITDKDRLDFLQMLTNKAEYTGRVVCRPSQTGRGWRLHETSRAGAPSDVREAIDLYMKHHAKNQERTQRAEEEIYPDPKTFNGNHEF